MKKFLLPGFLFAALFCLVGFGIWAGIVDETEDIYQNTLVTGLLMGSVVVFLIASTIFLFVMSREKKILIQEANARFVSEDYEGAIIYLERRINKYWFYANDVMARSALVTAYMIVDRIEAASELIKTTKWLASTNSVAFFKFLLALGKHDVDAAKKEMLIIGKFNTLPMLNYKIIALSILNTIENGVIDENLYAGSIYPIIREILDYYGKHEELNPSDTPFSSGIELEN